MITIINSNNKDYNNDYNDEYNNDHDHYYSNNNGCELLIHGMDTGQVPDSPPRVSWSPGPSSSSLRLP